MKKLLTLIFVAFAFAGQAQPIQADPNIYIGEDATYADYWELKAVSDTLEINASGIASPGIKLGAYTGTGTKVLGVGFNGKLIRTSFEPGQGPSFGLDNQIPFTNSTVDDFDYSANFTYNGTTFSVGSISMAGSTITAAPLVLSGGNFRPAASSQTLGDINNRWGNVFSEEFTFDKGTNEMTLTPATLSGDVTVTFPAATGTVVYNDNTATITNKTINSSAFNGTIGATTPSTVAATSGTFSSRVGIGTSVHATYPLHVVGTSGFIIGQDVTTDATTKTLRVGTGHYTNAEEPFIGLQASSLSTTNTVNIGGGSAVANAATGINFYTAANNTTTTGTLRGSFAFNGDFRVAALAGTGDDIVYADADGDLTRSTVEITDIGDVDGPASSTDDAIARFDGTTGKIIQNSGVIIGDEVSNGVTVHRGTTDGSDNKLLQLAGGGGSGNTRGATVQLNGNEHASAPGQAVLSAGNVANGYIQLVTFEGSVFMGASNPVRIVGKIPYTSAPAGTLNSNEWEQSLYDDGASPVVRFRYNDAGTTKTIDVGPLVSDTVYKKSWEPMLTSDAKSFVMNTKPYKWYGKGDVLKGEHWGFIANYSPKSPAFPISEDGTYHWKPEHMIAPLYAVVQEQQKEIDYLKSKLSSLEERILAIEKTTKNK